MASLPELSPTARTPLPLVDYGLPTSPHGPIPARALVHPFAIGRIDAPCSSCARRDACLPATLSASDMARIDSLIGVPQRVASGRMLYRSGEALSSIYVVRSGFFKTVVVACDGREHVTGFQMMGDMMGVEGISTGEYVCTATALEDSYVCRIPFAGLETLLCDMPALQHHFHRLMSGEIVRDQGMLLMLGTLRAEARLAAFLLTLGQRFAARGYSASEFHLRMTRAEIGSYLGVQLETVSRVLSMFQSAGLITVERKHVRLLDAQRLREVMGRGASPLRGNAAKAQEKNCRAA